MSAMMALGCEDAQPFTEKTELMESIMEMVILMKQIAKTGIKKIIQQKTKWRR
jgi:hypothetical protein